MNLILLAFVRHYLRHPWMLGTLLCGVVLGVTVVTAVELTNHSVRANLAQANAQLLGRSTHRILADKPIDEALLRQLRTDAGIEAEPVLQRYLRVGAADGPLFQLIAADSLRPSRAGQGRSEVVSDPASLITTPNSVLIGAISARRLGIERGASLSVQRGEGEVVLQVIGVLGADDDRRFSQLLIMDIGWAQRLFGQAGQLDALDLVLQPAQVDRVRALLPAGHYLVDSQAMRASGEGIADALLFNLSALSLLALLVGLLLVYNTLTFSLLQRQPLFGQLRCLGVTAGQLYRYIMLELLLLSVVGCLGGLWVGVLLADQLLVLVTRTVNDLYAVSPLQSLVLTPKSLLLGCLAGVGGVILAGLLPARRVVQGAAHPSRLRITQEWHARQRLRHALWWVPGLVLSAWLILVWPGSGLEAGFAALTLLLLAGLLVVPGLLRLFVSGAAGFLAGSKRRGRTGLLLMALRECSRGLSRTAIAVQALTLAMAATVGIALLIGSFRLTLTDWLQQRLSADIYLTVRSVVPDAPQALPTTLLQAAAAQPEVQAISTARRREAQMAGHRFMLLSRALPAAARQGYRFIGADAAAVWARFDQPGGILVSEPLARRLGLQRADVLRIDGFADPFQVAGIYYDYGYEQGRAIVPAVPPSDPEATGPRRAGLYLHDGASVVALIDWLNRQPGAENVRVVDAEGLLARSLAIFERTFLVTEVLRVLALLVAFVAMLSALLSVQMERQPEMALYRALGFSAWERTRLLLYQGVILGGVCGLAAIPMGLLLAWGLIDLIQLRAFGWTLFYRIDPLQLVQAPFLAMLTAFLATLYPAWRQWQGVPRRGSGRLSVSSASAAAAKKR